MTMYMNSNLRFQTLPPQIFPHAYLQVHREEIDILNNNVQELGLMQRERLNMASERIELERKRIEMRKTEEMLNVPFDCAHCHRTLPVKLMRNFCLANPRLQRIGGMNEEEHACFQSLRLTMKELFEKADGERKGYFNGEDLCKVLDLLKLAELNPVDRGRQRQHLLLKRITNREKRLAMQEFNASRMDKLSFDEFWDRLSDANHRPPLYVMHFLLSEFAVDTSIIDTKFPHDPVEGR